MFVSNVLRSGRAACATALACLAFAPASFAVVMAPPVTHYTSVYINSATSVNFDMVENGQTDYTGGTLDRSAAGTHTLAYGDGNGNFQAKPTTDEVHGVASLATGQLKALSMLALGAAQNPQVVVPLGRSDANASVISTMADTFYAVNAGTRTPYLWSNGSKGEFKFNVSGSQSIPDVDIPTSYAAGQPKNDIFTAFTLNIYKAGTLDLIEQLNHHYDMGDFNSPEVQDLNNQVQANRIAFEYWYIGDAITPFTIDPAHVVPLDATGHALIDYFFEPGGDFDWVAQLTTELQIDSSYQNVSATLDFSHTLDTDYIAPDGTDTFSASGEFPNTLALPTPEPTTVFLFTLFTFAPLTRRRRAI
ncbi:MAG: hypothetical protein GC162_19445 [Planctomycetes bacterium]|nr:hypothetical protein [Planctomycetota bacterium]